MAQPIRNQVSKSASKPKPRKKKPAGKRPHPKYGTSGLERRFAKDFLDKLGVEYVYQFEAKGIGRFFDYFIPAANLIIEVDGDYFHGYGLLHEEKSPMQKHNERVDREKDQWAAMHGIPVLRIWEHDINDHPEKVRKILDEQIGKFTEKKNKKDEKNKRH